MFRYKTTVRIYDTDAFGILYYGNQYRFFSNALEEFLKSKGLSLGAFVKNSDYYIAVVHCEADFKAPLRLGDELEILLTKEKIGNTSFSLNFSIEKSGQTSGFGKIVYVVISQKDYRKAPIPVQLRRLLESI